MACPGVRGLQIQTRVFESSTTEIPTGDVYDFINESDCKGHVYFINWDKINNKSNTVLKEGEVKNLMERVASCHSDKIDIFMLVDEEQRFHDAAEKFINTMSPKHVLRISATPVTQNAFTEVISDEEVISTGLIASGISINEGLSIAIEENNKSDDDLRLIDLADKKRIEIQNEYSLAG